MLIEFVIFLREALIRPSKGLVLEPLVRSISEFVLVSKGQVAIKLKPIKASVPMLELESNMYAKFRGVAQVCLSCPRSSR